MAARPDLNYDNTPPFRGVIAVCEREADTVQVGFQGGITALRRAARQKGMAQARDLWKIRYPKSNRGVIIRSNWIDRTVFLSLADELRAR